jgi:hypothetical protein
MKMWLKRVVAIISVTGLAASVNQASASENRKKAEHAKAIVDGMIQGKTLSVGLEADGSYFIKSSGSAGDVLHSDVEAVVDGAVLRSTDYPRHQAVQADFHDDFGAGSELTETNTGLAGKPDLTLLLRLYRNQPWGDIQVRVVNTTGQVVSVSALRRQAGS